MQNPDWLAQCVESMTRPKPIITPELLLAGLAFLVSVVSVGVSVFFYIDKQRKDSVDETRRIRLSVFTILFLTPQLINLKEFFSEFDRVLCALPDGIVSLSVGKQVNEALLAGQEKLNGEFVDLLTAFDREPYNSISKKIEAVLKRLYNLSDEQMEYQLLDRMSYKRFCGLANATTIPDRTTVWTFENPGWVGCWLRSTRRAAP